MTPRGNLAYSDPKLSFSEEVSHEMRFLKDSRSTKARFFDFRKRAGCGAAVSCSDHARIMVKSSVYWRKALRDFLIKSWLWFLEEMSQSCGWRFQIFAFCCLHFFVTGTVFCAHVLWSSLFAAVPLWFAFHCLSSSTCGFRGKCRTLGLFSVLFSSEKQ